MSLLDDIRYGVRSVQKRPKSAAIIVATLALGIGANSALFSVVNAFLLRPLPYDHPERIAAVWRTTPSSSEEPHAAGDFLDVERGTQSFESIAAFRTSSLDLAPGSSDPRWISAAEVTNAFFDVFGMPAAVGRALEAQSDRPGDRRVVLSYGTWQGAFGSDPAVIGRSVRLGSVPMTIVGVMPRAFAWPQGTEVWVLADRAVPSSPVPLPDAPEVHRGLHYLDVVARLRPGTSWAKAQGELDGVGHHLAKAFPENDTDRGYRLVPVQDQLTGRMRASLWTLLGVVALVLVMACANVASLLLARGIDRHRELAVRASLGASPARLVRQLLAESVALSLLGAALGLLLAREGTILLLRLLPGGLPVADVRIDWTVLAFTTLVAVFVGLLFGIAPALQASRVAPLEAMQSTGRSVTASGGWLRSALVAGEVALAIVVLNGAGLLLHSFMRLVDVNPGFLTGSVVTVSLPLPMSRYPTAKEQARFYGDLVEQLGASGRFAVAAGFPTPFDEAAQSAAPLRRQNHSGSEVEAMTLFATVSPSYFRVLGIPLLAGRAFTEGDEPGKPSVAIISRAAATRIWPGEDPIGQRLTLGSEELFEVVGIVGDVRRKGLDQPADPVVYLSYRQAPLPLLSLFVRGADPAMLSAQVRTAVRALDKELPVGSFATLGDLERRSVSMPRFRTAFLGLFAAIGLVLAAIGLFGIVSDGVLRRTRELGIRMALGAERKEVVRLVLATGLRLSTFGILVGLCASLALGRLLSAFLFGVGTTDVVTLLEVSVTFLVVALVATYLPARRASRLDPVLALRAE